jgi:hypothetical protein
MGICTLAFLTYLEHLIGDGRIARYQRRSMPVTKASFSRSARRVGPQKYALYTKSYNIYTLFFFHNENKDIIY